MNWESTDRGMLCQYFIFFKEVTFFQFRQYIINTI